MSSGSCQPRCGRFIPPFSPSKQIAIPKYSLSLSTNVSSDLSSLKTRDPMRQSCTSLQDGNPIRQRAPRWEGNKASGRVEAAWPGGKNCRLKARKTGSLSPHVCYRVDSGAEHDSFTVIGRIGLNPRRALRQRIRRSSAERRNWVNEVQKREARGDMRPRASGKARVL